MTTDYRDRHTWLIVFGVIQILLGALCLMGLLFAGMGMAMSSAQGQMPARFMLPGLSFYLAAAAFWVTMGIGSLRARRWARSLMLVLSWLWLVMGVVAVITMVTVVPRVLSTVFQEQGMAHSGVFLLMMVVFMTVFYGFFLVVLPLVFIAFYRSPHVRATCEARNPAPCWTDRCPPPVLALSLVLAWGAFNCLMSLPIALLPFFGHYLTGFPAVAIMLVIAGLLAWLAYAAARLHVWAWWTTLLLVCGGAVSTSITFARISLAEMMGSIGMPPESLAILEVIDFGVWMVAQTVVMAVVSVGYLVFVKRYFTPSAPSLG